MFFARQMKRKLIHVFIPGESNNQRPQLLHPAGLSVIVGFFLLNFALKQLINLIPGFVLGFSSSVTVEEVINLTNQERVKAGLKPLTQSTALSQAAVGKARDMFTNNYWSHISPGGTQPWDFIKNAGYGYRYAGENLARDFSNTSSVISAWLDSPSHRENLLSSKYSEIGVAVVDGSLQGVETRLVVQMFGFPIAGQQLAQAPANPSQTQKVITQPEAAISEQVQPEVEVAQLEETGFGQNLNPGPEVKYAGTQLMETVAVSQPDKILVSPTQVTQTFGAILVMLILGTLVIDWVIAYKRNTIRLVGKNWAHLTFLGAVVLMIIQYAQGRIL